VISRMEDIYIWNNSQADIVKFFIKMRENQKFFDVTLVTDDGQHIQAHKLILAAASLFFEDIFLKNNHNQTNMLIYLKGIHSRELEHVLNFLYAGEAVISQEVVQVFLETAKELQVSGIDYEDSFNSRQNQIVNDNKNEVKIEVVKSSDICLVEVSQKDINAESGSNEDNPQLITNLEHKDRGGFENSLETKNKSMVRTCMENVQVNKNEELDVQVQQMLVKKDGLWECKFCGKTSLYCSTMREHTETHIEGISQTCHICSKTFGTRHTLRVHISGVHSELLTCDICGKSGMNKKSYWAHQQRKHKA